MDNGVDEAIDRAARELTNADLLPGFERRVMTRLQRPPARSSGWMRFGAVAAVASATILLAVALRQEPVAPVPGPGDPRSAAETPTRRPRVQPEPASPSDRRPATATIAARPTPVRTKGRTLEVTAANIGPSPVDAPPIDTISPLDGPPPLSVENIPQNAVDVRDIPMPMIVIRELNVPSLQPLDERSKE